MGKDFTELSHFRVDPDMIRKLARPFCESRGVVPLRNELGRVVLGMVDPTNDPLREMVEFRLGQTLRAVRLNRYEVGRALDIGWGTHTEHPIVRQESIDDEDIIAVVDHMLLDAVERGASDIHIEAYHGDVDVRLRLNGLLYQVHTTLDPTTIANAVARIKVMSDLDLSERRRPQDGRFSRLFDVTGERKQIDFRVNTIPGPHGEEAVLRVLNPDALAVDIEGLGMNTAMHELFVRVLSNPEGMTLVTGPTGSGKTTTLYAALNHLNDGRRKIITAEDPIEYDLPKINQKQVSDAMGMSSLARALMRQDPDVILFGEIRDEDTGNTALAASMTGHNVLSTLHTPDALGSITRLRGLGLDPVEISNALLALVGQRLARRICNNCKEVAGYSPEQLKIFAEWIGSEPHYQGAGCDACHGTGVSGRVGLFELVVVDEGLQDLIADNVHRSEYRRYVQGKGTPNLLDDALDKALAGQIALDEVQRIIPMRTLLAGPRSRGNPCL